MSSSDKIRKMERIFLTMPKDTELLKDKPRQILGTYNYDLKTGEESYTPNSKQITMDTAKGNRVLAEKIALSEFMGWVKTHHKVWRNEAGGIRTEKAMELLTFDYNALHEVWVKFRDLRFEDAMIKEEHFLRKNWLVIKMSQAPLSDFYKEMVNAVEWVNGLKQTT